MLAATSLAEPLVQAPGISMRMVCYILVRANLIQPIIGRCGLTIRTTSLTFHLMVKLRLTKKLVIYLAV